MDTVGRNKKVIAEHIRNQLTEDKNYEQLTMKELFDPFTGESVGKGKSKASLRGKPENIRGWQTFSAPYSTNSVARYNISVNDGGCTKRSYR